jgi:hypothetical protein
MTNGKQKNTCFGCFGNFFKPGPFENGISNTWSSSRKCKEGPGLSIQCSIPDDGKIYEPQITYSTGDDQYDAECLEAVCAQSPVPVREQNWTATMRHPVVAFGSSLSMFIPKPRFSGAEINLYLSAKPAPKGSDVVSFVLIHKIPVSILNRYPGLFEESEILNPANLMEVPFRPEDWNLNHLIVPYVQPISCFYACWSQFFRNEKVTRDEVFEWAKQAEKIAKDSNGTYIP